MAGFCRALRRAGVPVTVGEEIDASNAMLALQDPSPADFRVACRVTLLKDPGLARAFDAVFDAYWLRDPAVGGSLEDETSRARLDGSPALRDAEGLGSEAIEETALGSTGLSQRVRLVLYSADAPSRPRVLQGIERARLQEMERRARHLRRRIATLPGRRHRGSARGEVDFRRAARRSLRYAGEWVDLPRRRRTLRRTRLLVVWDVSGSLEDLHEDHFALVYALQRMTRAARVFAFGTELHEVTGFLRASPYPAAVLRMESLFTAWGGGTRIGESLAALNARAGTWVDRRTVVVVLSDGWDIGNLTLLRDEMARLARRAGAIVWLNPNASEEDFHPDAAGMRTALPYVDLLLSTEVLSSPSAFRRELGPSLTPIPLRPSSTPQRPPTG